MGHADLEASATNLRVVARVRPLLSTDPVHERLAVAVPDDAHIEVRAATLHWLCLHSLESSRGSSWHPAELAHSHLVHMRSFATQVLCLLAMLCEYPMHMVVTTPLSTCLHVCKAVQSLPLALLQAEVPPRDTRARSPQRGAQPERNRWHFDHCLPPDARQHAVFRAIDMPAMLANALQGFPAMVFAFGQTGSGKTHTLLGPASNYAQQATLSRHSSMRSSASSLAALPADAGLLPEAVHQAFALIPAVPHRCFEVSVSVLEVYNERASDLLAGGRGVAVRQSRREGFYAEGLKRIVCRSADEAWAVLRDALAHR